LRIGRYFGAYNNIMSRLKETKGCPFTRMLKNIADVALSLNFIFDHVVMINKINAYKFSLETLNKADFLSNFFWLVETICTLTIQSLELIGLKDEIIKSRIELKGNSDRESTSIKIAKLELEYYKKVVTILRCLTDLPVRINLK
jgi:hypothetical protein